MILALKILAVIYVIGVIFFTLIGVSFGYGTRKILRAFLWPLVFFFGG